jgi:hypothetical protein
MTDVPTVIGDVIGGVGVAVAAYFGYRAAVAGRQAVEQGRLAVAEARTARREERLFQELARLERLIDIVKRMWATVNRLAAVSVPNSPAPQSAGLEMDALLYELRASLAGFDQHELSHCRTLADSNDGRAALGHGEQIQEAESEVYRNTLSVSSDGAPPASVGVTLWRRRRRESWG